MTENGDLPKGWVRTSLEAVCQILDSRRIPVNNSERSRRIARKSEDNLYPYYGATGQVGLIDDFIFEGEHILLGEDGAPFLDPFQDKSYLVDGKFWVNNHAHILNSIISNKYVCHYLNQLDYSDHVTGTTRLKLTQNALKRIPVFVAPTAEQRRIVDKIEELFSELDKGVESLKAARAQLKIYRQAVLKHAFEGRLTAQWREENKDKLDTPEQLLARIKRDRTVRYEARLMDWKAAVKTWEASGKLGEKPAKPASFIAHVPISQSELTGLPDIPQSWQYVRLAEIAYIGSGMSVSKSRKLTDPVEIPYLSVANVQRGALNLSTVKTMKIEYSQLPRLSLERWDVLFNEGGDRDKLGRGWVWESQIKPCITQNHVFHARPILKSHQHSKLISHWGNTFGQMYFQLQGKQTTNLASINKTVLSRFPIPLPPIEEQEEIIQRLENQTEIIDHLEQDVASCLEKLNALRQSILKCAFKGRLVSQDSRDEPATVLLKRIRAERELGGMHPKTTKKSKRKRKTAA